MNDPIVELDKLLELFVQNKNNSILSINFKQLDLEYFNPVIELCNKLVLDGYVLKEEKIIMKSSYTQYSLTLNGRIFYQNGGYKAYFKNEKSKNRKQQIESILLTYGTALAGLYGLVEIMKWLASLFKYCIYV